jgi:hypothetical protein
MFSSWTYQPVPSTIIEDQASESYSKKASRSQPKEIRLRSPTPWIISTLILQYSRSTSVHAPIFFPGISIPGSSQQTSKPHNHAWIEYEERIFTGKLTYDPNKRQAYRDIDPTQPQYFGKPSFEMEAAWEDLLRSEFTPMSADEAAPFTPELRPLPTDGKYHFELDILHSLHCLNSVRMKLYEYIYQTPREEENLLTTDPED